jgi:formylglycine-generating enzyme required for sulfatase activity
MALLLKNRTGWTLTPGKRRARRLKLPKRSRFKPKPCRKGEKYCEDYGVVRKFPTHFVALRATAEGLWMEDCLRMAAGGDETGDMCIDTLAVAFPPRRTVMNIDDYDHDPMVPYGFDVMQGYPSPIQTMPGRIKLSDARRPDRMFACQLDGQPWVDVGSCVRYESCWYGDNNTCDKTRCPHAEYEWIGGDELLYLGKVDFDTSGESYDGYTSLFRGCEPEAVVLAAQEPVWGPSGLWALWTGKRWSVRRHDRELGTVAERPHFRPMFDRGGPTPKGFVRFTPSIFMVGAQEHARNRLSDAVPEHRVIRTQTVALQQTEVTQAQWRALMGTKPSDHASCGRTCPVEQVNWWDALTYLNVLSVRQGLPVCYQLEGCRGRPGDGRYRCDAVRVRAPDEDPTRCRGYRLPTESEWEGVAGHYSSHDGKTNGWSLEHAKGETQPVGKLAPNRVGLHDMFGNVAEWTWDRHGLYSSATLTDPTGPRAGPNRVARGGSCSSSKKDLKRSRRSSLTPDTRRKDLGFRAARTLLPE